MNRTTQLKIAALLIGTFIGVFIGEIGCRIYYFGADAFSYRKVNSFIPIGVSGYLVGADNYKVLYELRPNIDDYFKLKKFQTNSQGCRDREYSVAKPGNTVRGIVIGDSFTMGSGVEIENVYHSVVEKALNEKGDTTKYEMINFGVGGYNLLNYLGVLENKALPYDPDFVVIGFCANNDFMQPHEKHYEGNYQVKIKPRGKQVFFTSFLKKLIRRSFFVEKRDPKIAFQIDEAEKAFVEKMFGEFKNYSQTHEIPIIINYLSMLADNGNLEIIRGLAQTNELYFTDSNGRFDPQHLKQYCINLLDQHPNDKANKIFADALLNYEPFRKVVGQGTAAR